MDKEFREFELKDIFQTTPFRGGLQVPTGGLMSSGDLEAGNTPRISVTSMNNGIIGYYKDVDSKNYRIYENCISVSFLGTVFYHPYKASFDMKVHCLKPIDHELRRGEALYLVSCIQKLVQNNTYGNQTSSTDLPYMKVYLPVNNNEELDWDYMQERIEELEQERIEELEQYLVATGLNDYELTDEDIETLSLSGFGHYEERDSEDAVKVCKEFKISDLFYKKTMKGYPKVDENLEENPNGYYVYGQNIQRQHPQKVLLDSKYLHIVNEDNPILAYTSSVGEIGMICEPFYRSGDNGAFQGLFSKNYQFNKYELQFVLSILHKYFDNFGYTTGMSHIMDLTFPLPIQTDACNNPIIDTDHKYHPDGYIPDWNFMEKYIKAIEKIVIADVVQYKDAMISKTKEVVL